MTTKLRSDLLWGYLSFLILGVSGLVMNLIVSKFFGPEVLGVFNQSFAIYIIASQLAVGGIHYAVLRQVAQAAARSEPVRNLIRAALLLTGFLSALVFVSLMLLRPLFLRVFDSPDLVGNIPFLAPAVCLFALNKCLLAALNGLERMRAFSLLQSLRYLVIVLGLLLAGYASLPASKLSVVFLVSEGLVFCFAPFCLRLPAQAASLRELIDLARMHAKFGGKSFVSGLLLEANTRIDILMLGILMSDHAVGVFSMPAIIAEGAYQSLVVLRNIFNPKLSQDLLLPSPQRLIQARFRAAAKWIYPGFLLLMAGAASFLAIVLIYFLKSPSWFEQLQVALIIMAGVLVGSAFVPFDQLLILAGLPGRHSLFIFTQVATNILLNALLIPQLEIVGAALATGLTFALSPMYLNFFLKKYGDLRIGWRG